MPKETRNAFINIISFAVLILCAWLLFFNGSGTQKISSSETQSDELNITPEEFKKRFNDSLTKESSDYRIFDIPTEEGAVADTFNVALSPSQSIFGKIDKNTNKINSITIITALEQNQKDSLNSTLSLIALITAIDKTISSERSAEIVLTLSKKAIQKIDKSNSPEKMKVGKFTYSAIASNMTGVWFTVE